MGELRHAFCRALYNSIVADLRSKLSTFRSRQFWSYGYGKNWEVQGPDGFYWYGGAHCSYDAKFQALCRYHSEKFS